MRKRSENQGWFHHSRETLQLEISNRHTILHEIHTTSEAPSSQTLKLLKSLQFKVDEAIAVAKTRWLRHLAETIDDTAFNPKVVWEHIRLLSDGECHHSIPKVIQMKLPCGRLAKKKQRKRDSVCEKFQEST